MREWELSSLTPVLHDKTAIIPHSLHFAILFVVNLYLTIVKIQIINVEFPTRSIACFQFNF